MLCVQEALPALPPAHAQEGTLPVGYTVHKRKLVRLDGKKVTKKKLAKAA